MPACHLLQRHPAHLAHTRVCSFAAPRSQQPAVRGPAAASRRALISCQAARKSRSAKPGRSTSTRRGFGPGPSKQQEPWEAELISSYKVYYKPTFKPSRFQGPIELKRFEDGTVGIVADSEVSGAELLLVSHPLAFMEGAMGQPPAVEELHASIAEQNPGPIINKIFGYLPRKPIAVPADPTAPAAPAAEQSTAAEPSTAAEQPAAAAEQPAEQSAAEQPAEQPAEQAAAAAEEQPAVTLLDEPSAAGPPSPQQQLQQQQLEPNPPQVPPSLAHLVVSFWEQLGPGGYADSAPLSSRQLMRMLQAASWSEELQDPAASQVRHERPQGFIGVWPELAFFRHSCCPNSSAVVVGRYLLMHATSDVQPGQELTFNKLGGAIAAPLAVRQQMHQELFGRPCSCRRCTLEQQLPQEAAEKLQEVYQLAQSEWPQRLQEVLEQAGAAAAAAGGASEEQQAATAEALSDLQLEVAEGLLELDEVLAPAVSDREGRLLLLAAAYNAFDLDWQMEELLSDDPDHNKLAYCVSLLRLFAPGTESHVYSSMLLDQALTMKAQELSESADKMSRKTLMQQKRLTARIQQLLGEGEAASLAYMEALACRYGLLPQEGLVPQLEQGLTMFYAGMSALSAAQGDGLSEVPEITRNLTIDGISVTVVDTVEGSAFPGPAAAAAAGGGEDAADAGDVEAIVAQQLSALKIQLLEDEQQPRQE